MESLAQDLRYSIRLLMSKPGFTIAAIMTLTLAIAVNSAVFSVVNSILFRRLVYHDPDRLVFVWVTNSKENLKEGKISFMNFSDWRSQNQSFEDLAAFSYWPFNLSGDQAPERVVGGVASASFFPLLGVQPIIGRTFTNEEEREGHDQVAVLSYGLWQHRFNADPNILQRTVQTDGKVLSIIGVLPPDFSFPGKEEAEMWTPPPATGSYLNERGLFYLTVIGRLKPGVLLPQAQSDMNMIASRLEEQYPDINTNYGINLVSFHEQIVGKIRAFLLILLGAVGLILLIACANVANLLLSRSVSRQKEIAIRIAVGATRSRLIKQLLTESVVLAVIGGLLGMLLAYWGIGFLISLSPADLPRIREVSIDGRVLLFSLAVTLISGVIFGLAPALQASKPNIRETLNDGGRNSGDTFHGRRTRNLLVVSEVASSVVLLIGAGLLIRSFVELLNTAPGFDSSNVLTMRVTLLRARYPERPDYSRFYQQVLQRLKNLPNVESVGAVTTIPLTGISSAWSFSIEGRPVAPNERPSISWNAASEDYFKTMRVPLIEGRVFNEYDTLESNAVVVINQALARQFFSDEDPIGKYVNIGLGAPKPREIVGVVGNVKQTALDSEEKAEVYTPYTQLPWSGSSFVIRTQGDPMRLASAVRNEVWTIDKDQPITKVRTMENIMAESVSQRRFIMIVLGVFAAVALLLAAAGIYAVIAYSVAQRTHEMGVRMALGAQASDLTKLVVGQAMMLTLAGVAIGLAGAFALTRIMSSLLHGVSATDPITFVSVSVLLTVVSFVASYIPALKVTGIDPIVAVRRQ